MENANFSDGHLDVKTAHTSLWNKGVWAVHESGLVIFDAWLLCYICNFSIAKGLFP
jgi:hypothetical protein